jgi:AcrR family transcriptional regulator
LVDEKNMVRLSREESRALTRERLLDSARKTFARDGYNGATVDEIAENAGYSKGAFYSNFENKEAIFLEILYQHKQAEVKGIQFLLDSDLSAEELIGAISNRYQELNTDADWSLLSIEFQLQVGRSSRFAEQFAQMQNDHCHAIGRLLQMLFEKAQRRMPGRPEDLANGFIAMTFGLALQRATGLSHTSSKTVGETIGLFLEALVTPNQD